MTFIDIVILFMLAYAAFKGWITGLFAQLASMIGCIVGIVVAFFFYSSLSNYLSPKIGSSSFIVGFLAFLILCIGIPVALSFVARILTKVLDKIYLGSVNSLAGSAIAILKYSLLISFALNFLSFTHLMGPETQEKSLLVKPMKHVLGCLWNDNNKKNTSQEEATCIKCFFIS